MRAKKSRVENALRLQRQARKFSKLLSQMSLEEMRLLMSPSIRPNIYTLQGEYGQEKGNLALLECPQANRGTAIMVWDRAKNSTSLASVEIHIDECHKVVLEIFSLLCLPEEYSKQMLEEVVDICAVRGITKVCMEGAVTYTGWLEQENVPLKDMGIVLDIPRSFAESVERGGCISSLQCFTHV